MHLPINHRLAGFYRFLAALAGLYVLVFGILGVIRTAGDSLFDRGDVVVLGLHTNLAFSLLSVVVGVIVLVGAAIGRNFAHYLNLFAGGVFLAAGIVMLLLLETDANFLNFTVATCVASFLIGTFLVLAGLYGKSGSAQEARHEDEFRHSSRAPAETEKLDTPEHHLSAHPDVKHLE